MTNPNLYQDVVSLLQTHMGMGIEEGNLVTETEYYPNRHTRENTIIVENKKTHERYTVKIIKEIHLFSE